MRLPLSPAPARPDPISPRRLAAGIATFAPGITATSFTLSLGSTLLVPTGWPAAGAVTGVQLAVLGLPGARILLGGAVAKPTRSSGEPDCLV